MVVSSSCAKKLIYLLSMLLTAEMGEAVLTTDGKPKQPNTLKKVLCLKSLLHKMHTKRNVFVHSECHVLAPLTKCSCSLAFVVFRPILEVSLCVLDYIYDLFLVHG